MTARSWRNGLRPTLISLIALTVLACASSDASAATQLSPKAQTTAIRSLASQPHVKRTTKLRVSGNKVSITQLGVTYTAQEVGAFRSSIDAKYSRIDLVANGTRLRLTALVKKSGGKRKVLYWGQRFDIIDYLCRTRSPNTLIVSDLGLGPVAKGAYGAKRCKNPRELNSTTSAMSTGEVEAIRAMYEPVFGEQPDGGFGLASPVEPDFKEPSASCDWNGALTAAPTGRVAKSDPRFGVLHIACITGSVNGIAAYGNTDLLVSRSGSSGSFTRLLAHVKPAWSPQAWECLQNRKWPVPAAPRTALDFCSPYPAIIRTTFNGPAGL